MPLRHQKIERDTCMPVTLGTLERDAANIRIFVLGDVNLDTLIVPLAPDRQSIESGQMAWLRDGNFWRHRRRGGTWLLTEIINAALNSPNFAEQFGRVTAKTYDQRDSYVDNANIRAS